MLNTIKKIYYEILIFEDFLQVSLKIQIQTHVNFILGKMHLELKIFYNF